MGVHGRHVSSSTIQRRLHEQGLYSRRPRIVPPLNAAHRRHRLQWAQQHQAGPWDTTLFSDESSFTLGQPDGNLRVWRSRGERHNPECLVQATRSGRASVMVWGGITEETRTPLHIFERGITAQIYTQEVLQARVVPFLEQNQGITFFPA